MVQEALDELKMIHEVIDLSNKKNQRRFEAFTSTDLQELSENIQVFVLHEAQYLDSLQELIEQILSDELKVTLVLTCSFEPKIDEVLREVLQMQGLELLIYPPTFYELAQHFTLPEEEKQLENRLIFGMYPAVVENFTQAQEELNALLEEVIFTQLGVNDRINKKDQLKRMLQIVAFNTGMPISYNEIGEKCGLDNETVERYVRLLENAFLLIKLPSLFNNMRYELKKSHLFYFVDNGIRNALIQNFNPPELRMDLEQLWRNWLIAERIKWNNLHGKQANYYFWRTHTNQMVDFIEKDEAITAAYKCHWEKKKPKIPALFTSYYPEVKVHLLNRKTYWGFLTKK